MTVLAHRGITAVARDNSAEAMTSVVDAVHRGMYLGIETDIRAAKDGLIYNHDAVERGLIVAEHTRDEIGAALNDSPPLFLHEGLELMAPIPVLNLEIKEPGMTAEVVEAAQDHLRRHMKDYDNIMISSFIPEVLAEVKAIDRHMPTVLLILMERDAASADPDRVLERMVATRNRGRVVSKARVMLDLIDSVDADFLAADWTDLCSEVLDGLSRRNKRLVTGSNNERMLLELTFRPEVAHVCTDFPDMAFHGLRTSAPHRKLVGAQVPTEATLITL